MNYGMRLFQNILVELTIKFIDYCKEQNVQLTERPQFLIRRNISVNPLSKILKTYDNVRKYGVNVETAKFADYLKEQAMCYLYLAEPFFSYKSAPCIVSQRNRFFESILRKEKRRI